MATVEERVRLGAEWLDVNRPGWVDRINLEALDLRSGCNCVLGQEFGAFRDAPEDIWVEATEHGFDALTESEYRELTAAWRDHITARRAAA